MARWDGWKIRVEIYGGHFDTFEEAEHYTNFLEGFLAKRFLGAHISTYCTAGVEGEGAERSIDRADGEADFEQQSYAENKLEAELHDAVLAFEHV